MNPLNHFGIKTQFIRGDTKSYNKENPEWEKQKKEIEKRREQRKKSGEPCKCISKYGDGTGHCERCGGVQDKNFEGYFE